MKLIIQIPCFNEEAQLAETLRALPRKLDGIDIIEWLVVNDGSTDRTLEIARAEGVDHIVDLPFNMGLARGFMAGLQRALLEGADIIVNTDADNQYNADDIVALIEPIIARRAQFVIGDRPIATIEHFSRIKRLLQRIGSGTVRFVSGTSINDAPSGFRAIARDAALRINIFDGYTYTLESVIQTGLSNIPVLSVPIRVNGETRPSRLIRSIPDYVSRSIISILRTFFVYRPGKTFFLLGIPPFLLGAFLSARWVWLFLDNSERSHVPSLVAAAILILVAVMLWIAGLLGEQLAINRHLLQDIQYALRLAHADRRLSSGVEKADVKHDRIEP
ncbi:MAG: glycosyltransferase family 2 protein [Parvibaculum sp.]|uniref:glycosyltransferase family 2 protein n=1 Tax=Parvibaculum sp. TaxID=2024848 RepID=UPI002848EAFD|nr:glycosyltransferase family 2 protein [Parvibaculum sp.]MDR3499366.1 glycosyltransferase family 2 protein [Parvibaculum sp.]